MIDGQTIDGSIQGISADVLYLDIRLPAGGCFEQAVKNDDSAFVYPYEGSLLIGSLADRRTLRAQNAGVLSTGEHIQIYAGEQEVAFLLLVGRPLREPIVQYGPFVMNTQAEIEQAISDYKNGQLV